MVRDDVTGTTGIVLADAPVLIVYRDGDTAVQAHAWLGVGLGGRPWHTTRPVPLCDEEGGLITANLAVAAIDEQLAAVRLGLAALGASV